MDGKKIFPPIIACLIFLFAQRYNVTFFKMGSMLPFFYLGMLLKAKNDFITKHKIAIGLSSLIVFIGLFPYFGAEDLFANKFFHTFTPICMLTICNVYPIRTCRNSYNYRCLYADRPILLSFEDCQLNQ